MTPVSTMPSSGTDMFDRMIGPAQAPDAAIPSRRTGIDLRLFGGFGVCARSRHAAIIRTLGKKESPARR